MITIAIAIATAGRRDLLSEVIAFMSEQTCEPDEVLICPAKADDADDATLRQSFPSLQIVQGAVGLPAQRNAIMAASKADIVVFFDDDFLPAPDYLAEVKQLFSSEPAIVVATGHVLADGILGPGLDFDDGRAILDGIGANEGGAIQETYGAYGCNMIVRMAPVRGHNVRFDENLPLYAWQEDIDFSRRLALHGRVVKSPRLRGVHLGAKSSGRSPGKRLGYSQIANPVYLARKGTLSWSFVSRLMARNLAANTVRSLSPEPWVDRRGRLKGNLIALKDILSGRVDPERILEQKFAK